MIKSALVAVAATPLFASAAFAGPYVNIENNAGFTGSSYDGNITEFHAGFEGSVGDATGYYVQAGPAMISIDGAEVETELSGKAGVGIDVSEKLNAYGELSFVTGDDANGYATKVGMTYSF